MNEQERREQFGRQQISRNIAQSRIPRHTRSLKIADLERTDGNENAFQAVAAFLGNGAPVSLLLIGVPGVGKTTLAYIIGWGFLNDGATVLYYQVEELLNELQARLEDGTEYGKLWGRLKRVDLLILDDLGAQNRTAWRDSQLDAMFDYRYRERLHLVVTANHLDISGRILDRLKEGATAVIKGDSWRGKGKNNVELS